MGRCRLRNVFVMGYGLGQYPSHDFYDFTAPIERKKFRTHA